MVENNLNSTAEPELGYGQLFAIMWRRRFWVLVTFNVALVIAGFLTLTKKPTYESSMQLLVEPNYQDRLNSSADLTNQPSFQNQEVDYATQLNLIRSNSFFEKAVASLSNEYPDLTIGEVRRGLSLSQVEENNTSTRIFQAVYTSDDPTKTQRVLEALQAVYQEYNLNQQEFRLTSGLSAIEKQLETVRAGLSETQGALEDFRQEQNLIDPEQEAVALSQTLTAIEREQQGVQAQYQAVLARSNALQQQLSLSPNEALVASRLSQSPRFQNLLNELQVTELQIATQRTIFQDTSDDVQVLQEQRQRQLGLMRQEIQRVLGEAARTVNASGEGLLRQGQMSNVDLGLVGQLAEAQTNVEALEAQRRSLALTEQVLREQLNQFPSIIAEYDRLKPEVDITRTLLQQLLEERERLSAELARGGFNWQVVEAPQLGEKIAPNPKLNMLIGAVLGLFLGGVAAFAREGMDRVIHTSDDLKRQTTLPLLGILPELGAAESNRLLLQFSLNRSQSPHPAAEQAMQWFAFRESLDLIYKNVQLLHASSSPLSLAITSALAGEGKSTLVLGLALSAARLHQRVLVIDADLRRPTLHKRLEISNEQGLSTLLQEHNAAAVRPIRVPILDTQIHVLPAGPEPPDPVRLLSSKNMRKLMTIFEEHYDLVLLDTPPMLGLVDAIEAASFCNGVVMVGRLDRITQTELNQATAMLSRLNVLGIVANGSKTPIFNYNHYADRNGKALVYEEQTARDSEFSQN